MWPQFILGPYSQSFFPSHLVPATSTMISDQPGSFTGSSLNSNVIFSRQYAYICVLA